MKPAEPDPIPRFLEYCLAIHIDTSPDHAIRMIKKINSYHQWTELLEVSGDEPLMVGSDIDVTIRHPKKESFTAQVVLVEDLRFAARQIMIAPWLLQAVHFFEIHPKSDKSVTFVQRWELRGIISKLFKNKIFNTLSAFQQMNEDFKNHLESQRVSA